MPRIREFLIQDKTRHGKTRYLFHRRPDGRRITIKGEPGHIDFKNRYRWLKDGGYQLLDQEKASFARQRNGLSPHTVLELGRHYRKFVDQEQKRRALSPHTVMHYGRFTERFIREFGPVPLDSIRPHQLERILDEWSATDNA